VIELLCNLFEVKIINLQITIFSDITCSLGGVYKQFSGTFYSLLQMQNADVGTRFFRNYSTQRHIRGAKVHLGVVNTVVHYKLILKYLIFWLFSYHYMFRSIKIVIRWFLWIRYVVIELLKWINFGIYQRYYDLNFNFKFYVDKIIVIYAAYSCLCSWCDTGS
jgi:hypothetical protein